MQSQARRGDRDHDRGREPDVADALNGIESVPGLNPTGSADGADEDDVQLSDDEVFEVLYNRRRRDVITYLRERDGTATASDLAEYIAAKENDITVQQLSSSERKRVYVGLYQNHLPMMDDVGVIDYDKDRGTVRLRASVAQLEPYLDDAVRSNTNRIKVAGALALAGVILMGVLDVGALAAVPDLLWIVVGVTGFVGLAVLDSYDLFPYR